MKKVNCKIFMVLIWKYVIDNWNTNRIKHNKSGVDMLRDNSRYIMYVIYFILAIVFRNQPHIAVLGIAITDITVFLTIKYGKRN